MKAKLLLISLFATSSFAMTPSDKKLQHYSKCSRIEQLYDYTIQMASRTGSLDQISDMPINIRQDQFNKVMNRWVVEVARQFKIESTIQPPKVIINGVPQKRNPYKLWNGELTWNKIATEYGNCVASYR